MVVSFDFDSTLALFSHDKNLGSRFRCANRDVIRELKRLRREGAIIYVVTERHERDESALPSFDGEDKLIDPGVYHFLEANGLKHLVEDVYFTNGCPKGTTLARIGSNMHYDDQATSLMELKREVSPMRVDPTTGNIKPWSPLEDLRVSTE